MGRAPAHPGAMARGELQRGARRGLFIPGRLSLENHDVLPFGFRSFGGTEIGRGAVRRCGAWLLATVVLAVVFLAGTTAEWVRLITRDGLTIGTNLFGTTFYALVGLHASHVIVGLVMLALISVFAWSRALRPAHVERVELVSWYWHFVDGVWVVVFTVVYVVGR